ncbi:MAG: hypothetical protein IJZ74_07170 [Clostridia bacterium]|nr:hypothetical protein [Clostridia bacterium]
MKRRLSLLLIVSFLLLLTACSKPVADGTDSYIGRAVMTETETELVRLLGDHYPQQIFDFSVPETVKSMRVRVVRLVDDQWVQVSGGGTIGMTYAGRKGRIALDYDTLDGDVKVSVQNDGAIFRMDHKALEQHDTTGLASAQTWLGNAVEIIPGKEIPLALQVFSSQSEIPLAGMDCFDAPEKYAGHEYVYAVTVTFSEQGFGE